MLDNTPSDPIWILKAPMHTDGPQPGQPNGQLVRMSFRPGMHPTLEALLAVGYTVVEEPETTTRKGRR